MNPVLFNGEPGYESDTDQLKIGNGVDDWVSLAYIGGGGSGITELTGDVTAGPGSGAQAATIATGAVTLAKMADIATDSIIGRSTAATGVPEVLTALPFAYTGDVTRAADSNVTAIANDAVTLAKIQNATANSRLIGSGAAGSGGDYTECTLGTGLSFAGTVLSVSGGTPVPGIDPRSAIYTPFTPTGIDDEFDDGSFSGWTLVNDGVTVPTDVETAGTDRLSVMHPGGGAVGRLCSYMKTQTPGTDSTIEIGFSMAGRSQSVNLCGLIFADGNTYGAGNQVVFYFNPQGSTWERVSFTNYNTAGAGATFTSPTRAYPRILLLRFKYQGSNNFSGWTSGDGQQWSNITGTFARTLSPTHVGFFVTTYGGAQPHNFCFDYFRYIA